MNLGVRFPMHEPCVHIQGTTDAELVETSSMSEKEDCGHPDTNPAWAVRKKGEG
jgi:hypothetical protein